MLLLILPLMLSAQSVPNLFPNIGCRVEFAKRRLIIVKRVMIVLGILFILDVVGIADGKILGYPHLPHCRVSRV